MKWNNQFLLVEKLENQFMHEMKFFVIFWSNKIDQPKQDAIKKITISIHEKHVKRENVKLIIG